MMTMTNNVENNVTLKLKVDVSDQKFFKLHPAQEDIYYDQLLHHQSPKNNIGGYTTMQNVDIVRLQQAWLLLHVHLDALQLTITTDEDGTPLQYIQHDKVPSLVEFHDFSTLVDAKKTALDFMQDKIDCLLDCFSKQLSSIALLKITPNHYYVFLKSHHIIIDGIASYLLNGYVHRLYQDLVQRHSTDWLLTIPQFKYAVLESREYIDSIKYNKNKAYWQQFLELQPSSLLPIRYSLPNNSSCTRSLSVELTNALHGFCSTYKLNLLAVFSSAVSLVVSNIIGGNEVVLNTPIHGRRGKLGMQVVGMHVNTCLFSSTVWEDLSVIEQIKTTMTSIKKSYVHCRFPRSHVQRLASRGNFLLSNITVTYDLFKNSPEDTWNESFKVGTSFDDNPLLLCLKDYETNSSLDITASFGQVYFCDSEMDLLLERLEHVLVNFIDSPTKQIKHIYQLLPHERDTLLYGFNDTDAAYPADKTLHELFAEQVAKTPDNIALVFEDNELTYDELDVKSNQLAHIIREAYQEKIGRPIPADTLIPLYFDRSLEMVISILAVLKAGGAYVPISPEYPAERTKFILIDTAAQMIMTQSQHLDTLTALNSDISHNVTLLATDLSSSYGDMPTEAPRSINTTNDLAYVIYTSGTTGKPKGVMIEHSNVLHLVTAQIECFNAERGSKALLFAAYVFDASVSELFVGLLGGQIGYLCSEKERNAISVAKLMQCKGINFATLPPVILNQLIDIPFPALKTLITAGESPSLHLLNSFSQHCQVFNAYGPTEITVCATAYEYQVGGSANNIGYGLNNTKLYVLNECLHLTPLGTSGELYIGGAGLARGYLNRPDLAKVCFIDNPFATKEDIEKGYTRLYKTGDLVRYLPDGNLEYLGRNDNQIKIRGYRIELGEIETALSALGSIKQAVVIDREREGNKYLAAYIIPNEQALSRQNLDTEDLIVSLAQALPEYMVPATFTEIEVIPLTINGKLDRRALPEPQWVSVDNYTAPSTELETQLCEIWQLVLGLEQVGVHDNFFRSGGDSITAIKLVSAIRRELDVDLALSVLFEQKNIAGIAPVLNEQALNQEARVIIPHIDRGDMTYYPASFAQAHMLFIEQLEQGSNAYHMPYLAQLDDDVNVFLLEEAINVVSERHPVMNTVYGYDNNTAYQQILDSHLTLRSHICHGKVELLEMVKSDIAQPFDLQREPSLRLNHYQIAQSQDQGQYILLMWHHIAMDGWSTDIFIHELGEVYQALKDGREIHLPALEINYGDYALWQRDYLQGEVGTQQLDYWRKALLGYETLVLPTDKPRPAQTDYRGKNSDFIVDKSLSDKIRELAKQQETTLYTVLLSAFYVSLAKLTGQEDIIVGSPSDNRHHAQTQNLIGMFVNSLALRAQVSGELDITEFIQTVHKVVSQAKSHQDIPFEQLVGKLNVERDSSRHPIFQIMFSVQDFNAKEMSVSKLPFTPVELEGTLYSPAKFDLSFFLSNGAENITGQINYAVGLFDETTIERMSVIFTRVLNTFIANPAQKLAGIDVLSTQDRNTLLYDFNETDAPYPQDKTLHQLFDEQVVKTPHNIALVFEGEQLTYSELNEKANQLAHVIRQTYLDISGYELKADALIPLYLDRSLEMVISILAVLKAGGAYVPISPEYPAERTLFILSDTAAHVVVTQSQYLVTLSELSDTINSVASLLAADMLFTYVDMPKEEPIFIRKPTDLAYVIYTSGTTGKPKGVMIEHGNGVHLVNALAQRFTIVEREKILLFSSYVFDVSIVEIFVGLSYGLTGYMCSESERNATSVSQILSNESIDITMLPPVILNQLTPDEFPALKTVISGGDSPSLSLLTSFKQHCQVFNAYGPTEITVCATANEYQTGDSANNIGIGFNNTKLYVLNECFQLTPLGASGELYIGGAGVARGYFNRPELTEQCFIDNPFATAADIEKGYTRLYKTGDLVRYLSHGHLEYLGRNDSQVKIRGYRIELGEIETALSSLDSVEQAVVIDNERGGNKYLAAYVISTDNQTIDADSLITALTKSLPEYMVPATFTAIDEIPLTINGKLDRRALPDPTWVSVDNYTAPRTALEAQLCDIWQSVLGIEQVGVHDNFFRSGGDSISAIKLVATIRGALAVDIPLSMFFIRPQIASFCDWLIKGKYQDDLLKMLTPESNAKQKLFMIHPSNAGCEVYMPLALTLSNTFNCIGIDNYNHSLNVNVSSLQQMASIYVDLILAHTSIHEPIHLLGWSLGGQLALEMTYLLESRGAKDINVFLLDSVMNSDPLNKLINKLDMPSSLLKIRERLYGIGVTDKNHIEKMLQVYPFEVAMSQCEQSGKLNHAEVTLFKAGLMENNSEEDDEVLCQISRLISQLPDNNVGKWVEKPITVTLINDKHHMNIIESIVKIRMGILKHFALDEAVELI
jgi:amino acid adenylation domain-containing protein